MRRRGVVVVAAMPTLLHHEPRSLDRVSRIQSSTVEVIDYFAARTDRFHHALKLVTTIRLHLDLSGAQEASLQV